MNSEVMRRAQAILSAADTLSKAGDFLPKAAGQPEANPTWPIIHGLSYHYIDPRDAERRKERGPFALMLELRDGVFPQALRDVADEELAAWAEYAREFPHPAARARLHDLLWERRRPPRPDEHARAAIDAYLDLAAVPEWRGRERAEGLDRALER